ncbi:MAG: hypothetical protein K1X28_03780 [Parachlamydiales bacterium]|nr:hypothetical protein [Parachlamydiales bacterium]
MIKTADINFSFNPYHRATSEPDVQEISTTQSEKVEEFVKKHFDIIATNVARLEDAQVICLGETHIKSDHRKHNGALIDMLSKKNDLVLVESHLPEPYDDEQVMYVQTPLEVEGWDFRPETTDDGVNKLFSGIGLEICAEAALILGIIGLFFWAPLISYILIPIGLVLMIAALMLATKGVQQIINDIPLRNQSLCKTIDEKASVERRVFAIAGSNHLRPVKDSKFNFIQKAICDFRPQDQAYEETLASLQKHKFAILVPKD